MNAGLYHRLLDISRAMKDRTQTGDKYHVSFLVRKSRVFCIGVNNYHKSHLAHRFGPYHSSKFSQKDDPYRPSLHSECAVAIKAGLEDWSGLELVNIRIDNNGGAAMSKCCHNCMRVVKALGPNRVFYSVDNQHYAEEKME